MPNQTSTVEKRSWALDIIRLNLANVDTLYPTSKVQTSTSEKTIFNEKIV